MVGHLEPIDDFDRTCMVHDAVYAESGDLSAADMAFMKANVGKGPLRTVSGLAVGVQGVARAIFGPNKGKTQSFIAMSKLRGASTTIPKAKSKPAKHNNGSTVQLSAPAAISNVFTSAPTKTRSIQNGIAVSGREYIGTVEGNGVTTFGIGKSALIAPAFFYNGIVGQMSRAYQDYRWKRLDVHYIPKVSTNVTGAVVLCSSENVNEPNLQPENTSFLARALVTGNGVMGPAWAPFHMVIPCDSKFRHVDPNVNVDINDNILAELQCYSQISVTQQLGYLWLDYELELRTPMLSPHLTTLPFLTGPGQRVSFQDNVAVNAQHSPLLFKDAGSSGLFNQPGGSIYRAVIDLQGSTFAGGLSASSVWESTTSSMNTATTGLQINASNITVIGGTVIFLVLRQGNTFATAYTSLEAAVAGIGNGQLCYQNVTAAVSTYSADLQLVRTGVTIIAQMQ